MCATRSAISRVRDSLAERGELVDLQDLDVAAERGAVLGEVGVDVEHAAVVVAHHAQAIVLHHVGDAGGGDPIGDFVPTTRVVAEHAGDLVERDAGPVEDVGDLRHGAGGAIRQPLARHLRPVAESVERLVVDRRRRLQIENDHRHFRAPHDRQHGRRQGVRRDVQEDEVDVRPAEVVPRDERLFRRVDQAEVHDLDAGSPQASSPSRPR